ncbi:MAG: helix-turn-helix transcriptional regulator [Archangium sp.]
MDRTERLLDLVALFLDARDPLTLDDIRDAFPVEFSGSPESSQRKWERDKNELIELGLPITFIPRNGDEPGGYVMDKNAYYLPELGLSPEELAVLYAAGSAVLTSGAFPGKQDLAHALRKVGFFADGPLPAPNVRLELGAVADAKELPVRLEVLWAAINSRKSVELDYFSPHGKGATTRKVNPWGLALRRGVWNLVGWCHLRQDVRTFHVHRIQRLVPNSKSPRQPDFEVPADFRVDEWVASWPWQHRLHPVVEVTVALRGELVPLAEQLFPVTATRTEESATVVIPATDLDGLITYVLSLGVDAHVIAPDDAMRRSKELAQKVLAAHSEIVP